MLIIADTHIAEKNIKELNIVFPEIEGYLQPGEILVCLGDWYHNKRLTATELEFGTYWAKEFLKHSSIFYLLRGNHPMINYKDDDSSVEYLKYLGINIVEDLVIDILKETLH